MVSSWFLSLMALSCCVCGLELNVTHTSYQEEEGQSLTLVWTFTPRPDPSLKDLSVHCDMWSTNNYGSDLLRLYDGVQIPPKDEEFSGRVQFDKDLLKEGRIRLHVSSLRTQDSGWYICEVSTESGVGVDRCRLSVSAARDQTHSKPGPEEPDSGSRVRIALCCALGLTAAVVLLVVVYIKVIHPRMKKPIKDGGTHSEKSLCSSQEEKSSMLSRSVH